MSKYSGLTKEYTVWCEQQFLDDDLPYEHDGHHQENSCGDGIATYVKYVEKIGWRYIKGLWYCPACAEKKRGRK